jgi:hypothetical protein
MFSHKLSWEKRYFCGLDKKDNFWCPKIAFHESFFVFLHSPEKYLFSTKFYVQT